MRAFTLRAFAKINLSLRIGDARPDGFHGVETILQSVELHDRLRFEPCKGPFVIKCSRADVPSDQTNLIWKAAQQLWKASGKPDEPRNAVVTLEKRIPVQAGLGGGSSDGAAALVGLRRLWSSPVSDDELTQLAARLGSDVPFFLRGGTALGLGRGEEIYPLEPLGRWWLLLLSPPFGVSTADAYRWLDEGRAGSDASGRPSVLPGTWLGRRPLVNDLEHPVGRRHPEIGLLKGRLLELGALMAAMSGSGSSVFGLFSSERKAQLASRRLSKSGIQAILTRTCNRP